MNRRALETLAARGERLAAGLLGGASWSVAGPARRRLAVLLGMIAAGGGLAGAVTGSHGGVTPDRWPQMLYSAAKVPLLLTVTFGLCVPTFFVLHALLGVRDDFGRAVRAQLAAPAVLVLVLAALSPFVALAYASGLVNDAALLLNAAVFGLATLSAQVVHRLHYRPLIAARSVHRVLARGWLVLYAFVGVQMAWTLRPFVGSPDAPTTFFRSGAWGNAYEAVWGIAVRALGG